MRGKPAKCVSASASRTALMGNGQGGPPGGGRNDGACGPCRSEPLHCDLTGTVTGLPQIVGRLHRGSQPQGCQALPLHDAPRMSRSLATCAGTARRGPEAGDLPPSRGWTASCSRVREWSILLTVSSLTGWPSALGVSARRRARNDVQRSSASWRAQASSPGKRFSNSWRDIGRSSFSRQGMA